MVRELEDLPEFVKGDWCNVDLLTKAFDAANFETEEESDYEHLRNQWAKDLLGGDLKAAHRSWGRWQGFTGGDPWEDSGWRNFMETQRLGERLWEDFDATRLGDLVCLQTYISYWPDADSK